MLRIVRAWEDSPQSNRDSRSNGKLYCVSDNEGKETNEDGFPEIAVQPLRQLYDSERIDDQGPEDE